MDCCDILVLLVGSEAGLWGLQIRQLIKKEKEK